MADDTSAQIPAKTAVERAAPELDETGLLLVAAALEVFEERGFERAGVQEIARRAGLTTGAIYSRFSGKDELLRLALHNCMHPEKVFNDPRAVDITSILSLLGDAVLEDDTNGVAARVMLESSSVANRDPAVHQIVNSFMQLERDRIGELIDQAKTDGLFDPELDTDATVKLCQSIGLGFMMFRALDVPMPEPRAWERVIATLIAAAIPPTGTTEENPSD